MIRLRRFLQENKGQALVELALILPILIMLLFGTIEFGRVFNAYLTVTSSSREGARAAAVGEPNDIIVQRVKDAATGLDHTNLNIVINPLSNRKRGESVSVEVEYKIRIYAPLIGIALDNPVLLKNRTTMRME